MPAATVQPETSERVKAVSSGTFSSERVISLASRDLNNSASKVGDAGLPTVSAGLGSRAKFTPF